MRRPILETVIAVIAVTVVASVLEYCAIVAFTNAIDDAAAASARIARVAR